MACEHRSTPTDHYLNTRPDGQCRLCRQAIMRNNYVKNKEKILQRTKNYRDNFPEKIKEIRKKYREKTIGYTKKEGIKPSEHKAIMSLKTIIWKTHKLERDRNKIYRRYTERVCGVDTPCFCRSCRS